MALLHLKPSRSGNILSRLDRVSAVIPNLIKGIKETSSVTPDITRPDSKDVHAIHEDVTILYRNETKESLEQARLASACAANHAHLGPRRNTEGYS